MGKIRLKTIGDEGLEQEEKKKAEIKRAEKLKREKSSSAGQAREKAEEVTEDSPDSTPVDGKTQTQTQTRSQSQIQPEEVKKPQEKSKKSKFTKAKARSANYLAKAMEVEKTKNYPLSEAIELLRKVKMTKFDETVELHINTIEPGINGMVKLPHGTGKEVRVAVASDEVLAEVEKGKINFDVLIAEPQMMPKLARVAKILGPRGLMPNPKNGTISDNPREAAKKFQGGQISFKTEAKNPLIHVSVGKTSFTDSALKENIEIMLGAIKKARIVKITLKSTMSPGIKIQA